MPFLCHLAITTSLVLALHPLHHAQCGPVKMNFMFLCLTLGDAFMLYMLCFICIKFPFPQLVWIITTVPSRQGKFYLLYESAFSLMAELVTPFSRSCDILTFYLIVLEQHLSFGAMLVLEKINKSLSSSHIFKVWHLLERKQPCGNQNLSLVTNRAVGESGILVLYSSVPQTYPSSDNIGTPQPWHSA